MVDIEVTISGPLFDGTAERELEAFSTEAERTIAERGVNEVKGYLDSVLRNPTGNYSRHIRTERQRDDMAVTDSKIVYGPWLDGTSSRNARTRFKGYATFRMVRQQLDAKSVHIADGLLDNHISRMN